MIKYKLDVQNWGDDVYMLASRGHHNINEFKDECFKEYEHIAQALKNCDCTCVHTYYKAVPCDGYSSYYVPSNKDVRGSFPVTVWWGA